jgi:hypothetical protein
MGFDTFAPSGWEHSDPGSPDVEIELDACNTQASPRGSDHSVMDEILDGVGQPDDFQWNDWQLASSDDRRDDQIVTTSDAEVIESKGTLLIVVGCSILTGVASSLGGK